MSTVYISHPIAGRTEAEISELEVRGTLWADDHGMRALLPRTIGPAPHDGPCTAGVNGPGGQGAEHDWGCYMKGDLVAMLQQADAILMMPGWERSNGARFEMQTALVANMPVHFYNADAAIDVAHLTRQIEFSERTFGPGDRLDGVRDHISKELAEIGDATPGPDRQGEWIDVVILALDGAWRSGMTPEQIIAGVKAKQARNEARSWPDWRTADPGKAIEHDRRGDDIEDILREAGYKIGPSS